MLLDSIDRLELYVDKIPHLKEALVKLEEVREAEPGRYEYDGGFILIQSGVCKPLETNKFEAHRKYVDVQCLFDGEEWFEWCDIRDLQPGTPYNEEMDKEMLTGAGSQMMLRPGMAVMFWPNDAHKAGKCPGGGKTYKKAVVKLAID